MNRYRTLFCLSIFTLALIVLISGCNSTPPGDVQPPSSGTSSELAQVVLQSGELPAEYEDYSLQDVDQAFPNTPEVLEGVDDAAVVLANTIDRSKVYSNGVIQYKSEDLAKQAFAAIRSSTRGTEEVFEIEPIGDEYYPMLDTIANSGMPQDIYLAMILWRDGPIVAYISSAQLSVAPDLETLESLARTVNERLP